MKTFCKNISCAVIQIFVAQIECKVTCRDPQLILPLLFQSKKSNDSCFFSSYLGNNYDDDGGNSEYDDYVRWTMTDGDNDSDDNDDDGGKDG